MLSMHNEAKQEATSFTTYLIHPQGAIDIPSHAWFAREMGIKLLSSRVTIIIPVKDYACICYIQKELFLVDLVMCITRLWLAACMLIVKIILIFGTVHGTM